MDEQRIREFEVFFKENENTVYRIIKGYTKSHDAAKDIVLESMMVVYDNWNRIKNYENKTGYIVKIAINKVKKRFLTEKVKNWLTFQSDEESLRNVYIKDDPEEKVLHMEEEEWLERELQKLKEAEKNIIIFKDRDKMKFDEIAALLNIKLPTVKSLYRRGKLKLAREWEASYAE